MKISKGTLTRTVLLILALLNQGLAIKGMSPIPVDNAMVTEFISLAFLGVASIAAWWKNNSFTRKAIQADEYKKQL